MFRDFRILALLHVNVWFGKCHWQKNFSILDVFDISYYFNSLLHTHKKEIDIPTAILNFC